MIDRIHLKDVATYDPITGVEFQELKEINFIYGANGTGKSTISKYLSNYQDTKYSKCHINWTTTIKPQIVVYNESFLESNFRGQQEIKGIFTLGQEDIERDKQIEDILKRKSLAEGQIDGFYKNIDKETIEKGSINEKFKNFCWNEIYQKYHNIFPLIFRGFNNNKEKFKNKLLESNGQSCSLSFEDLQKKYKVLYEKEYTQRESLALLDFSEVSRLKQEAIFVKVIIGGQDVPIASLINLIKGNDWVSQGRKYFEQTKPLCPFCQSNVSENFEEHLNDFFNEQFEQDVKVLTKKAQELKKYYEDVTTFLGRTLENISLNRGVFIKYIDSLNVAFQANLEKINQKIIAPSVIIQFTNEEEIVVLINELIKKENESIDRDNKLVSDKKNQQAILDNEIWAFLFSQISQTTYELYETTNNSKIKAIKAIETRLSENKKLINEFDTELIKLNATRTSIKPTIDSINNTLSSFGFTNFKLDESTEKNGFYRLIRPDGNDVNDTLSEGEKRFISFLYFYHLLKGGFNQEESMSSNLIVVIDDPISSLDSDVLYLVSTLIKDIIYKIKSKSVTNRISQLFILTHNTFFYKEVSHECQGNLFTYIVLRKRNQVTYHTKYLSNPIKTSYENLWLEYKQNNPSTIRNTMRKILENYFFVFGGMKLDDLPLNFTGEKRLICKALLSWLHDGSHMIDDNLYVDCSDDIIEKNKEVFIEIFSITNHMQHYEMMMK